MAQGSKVALIKGDFVVPAKAESRNFKHLLDPRFRGDEIIRARTSVSESLFPRNFSKHRHSYVIQLSVNGEVKQVEPGASIARLLESLDLAGKRIAVERNGEIVPRSRHAETQVAEGDRLEIVVAVGGG